MDQYIGAKYAIEGMSDQYIRVHLLYRVCFYGTVKPVKGSNFIEVNTMRYDVKCCMMLHIHVYHNFPLTVKIKIIYSLEPTHKRYREV